MADTSAKKNIEEPWVRGWLSERFPGHTFTKEHLKLTTGGEHEFDAVSQDRSIVTGIKGHSWLTRGGKPPSGKKASLYQELYFLSLVEAQKKALILTHKEAFDGFTKMCEGKVANGVEILFCELPAQMRKEAATIQERASREQRARTD